MRSVVPVLIDVEAADPSPCIEPRDGFLDLKSFSLMSALDIVDSVDDHWYMCERERSPDYIS